MKFAEGIKLKGSPVEIPDCSRDNLPQFFTDMEFKVGAEIGVYRGEFTEKFCLSGLETYAIDPWIGYSGAGRTEKEQAKQDINYEHARSRLAKYDNCTIIRETSTNALDKFSPESLDFVYIDGDHRFKYIAEDIYEWFSKVRKGGVVSGHDYFCTRPDANNVICHVKTVVDAFVETFGIENFYTFGRLSSAGGKQSNNNRVLSWMFFKP
jgi:hypothetical protein